MGEGGVDRAHLETVFVDSLPGMGRARIDQDYSTGGRKMFDTLVCKRLETSFDETNDIVIVTVTWKCMLNIRGLQELHVKPWVIPDLGPFLSQHDSFTTRGR